MTIVFVLVLLLALVFFIAFTATAATQNQSDAAGNALSRSFAILEGIALWVLLAGLTAIAATRGKMPSWLLIPAIILLPASAVTSLRIVVLLARSARSGQALLVVPILIPLILLAYASWAFFPNLPLASNPTLTSGVVWGSVLVLTTVPWLRIRSLTRRMEAEDEKRVAEAGIEHQRDETERQARELAEWGPKFEMLDQNTPLWRWMEFTSHGEGLRTKAFAGMRQLKRRQVDAEAMLESGSTWPLLELPNLDLDPTPALCDKARSLMRKRALSIVPPVPGRPYSWEKSSIDPFLPALEWLLQHGCDCRAELAEMENAVRAYPRGADRDQTLATLQRLRTK